MKPTLKEIKDNYEEEELQNSLSKTIDYYENYISKLNHQSVMVYASARNYESQLALTEKALELACDDLYWLRAFSGEFTKEDFISRKIDYYTKKAKEMMKSE